MKPTFIKSINNFLPFIKYCIVGVTGTAVDVLSLYIFVDYLGLSVLFAAALSFFLAVLNNFILNKIWTFKNKSSNYRKLFIKFFIVSIIGLLLTLFFMYLFTDIFKIWYIFAKLLTSLIVLTWNFFGNKLWTFKASKNKPYIPEKFLFDLSIVIPAYNEANRLKGTLLLINEYIKTNALNAEIIVVSDGSNDNTNGIVDDFKKKITNLILKSYKFNHGKGYAVKQGVEASRGKYILFTDADNSTPIDEFEKLFNVLKKSNAQVVIGSRYIHDSKVLIKQPKYRILLGRIGNFLISLFLLDGIKDTQCGFKLFEHKAAKKIFSLQKIKRFGFDMELLVIADLYGYKIKEVPVSWFNSAESRFRPVKDALITLKDLVYVKLNLWSGRYLE